MFVNLFAYWLINAPLCYYLAFTLKYGFTGLWSSMTVSLTVIVTGYHVFIARTDWQQVAEQAAAEREA